MTLRKTLTTLIMLSVATAATAQNDGFKLTWHGFVNPVMFGDTRQVVSGREGMMLFYPKPVALDAEGNDLNGTPQLNMLGITARLNLTFQGPEVLGAKMKGFIEGDFTGATDATINMFRLRHAYLDMKWQHDEVLAGQYWYPMVVEEVMPGTQPLNMGAPFHPYARYNQLRYVRRCHNWEALAVASFELDNKSQGPDGASTDYLRRSMVPELTAMVRYNGPRLFAGVAANYLRTIPVATALNADSLRVLAYHPYDHFSFSLFARYRWDNWTLKAQSLIHSNLYEGCSLGGYVIKSFFDPLGTASAQLGENIHMQDYNFTTLWADFGKTTGHWRPGIFAGYAWQNGYTDIADYTQHVGRGFDIANLWRVQPRIEYYASHGLSFSFEVEHTVAQYLKTEVVQDTMRRTLDTDNRPANTRFILGAVYAF